MRLTVSIAFLLALSATSGTAAASSDTHGCWTYWEKQRLQVIATTNVRCSDAVRFIKGPGSSEFACALFAKDWRCGARVGGYRCAYAIREWPSKQAPRDMFSTIHCMKGPNRRIGVKLSWVKAFGKKFTG